MTHGMIGKIHGKFGDLMEKEGWEWVSVNESSDDPSGWMRPRTMISNLNTRFDTIGTVLSCLMRAINTTDRHLSWIGDLVIEDRFTNGNWIYSSFLIMGHEKRDPPQTAPTILIYPFSISSYAESQASLPKDVAIIEVYINPFYAYKFRYDTTMVRGDTPIKDL